MSHHIANNTTKPAAAAIKSFAAAAATTITRPTQPTSRPSVPVRAAVPAPVPVPTPTSRPTQPTTRPTQPTSRPPLPTTRPAQPNNNRANTNGHNNRPYNQNRNYRPRTWIEPAPAPPLPKEKVLGPQDFPALPTSGGKAKPTWVKPEISLADKMRERIEEEEEARELGRPIGTKEEDEVFIVDLSGMLGRRQRALRLEENARLREMEEYEANYRWQISKVMIPIEPEPEVPVYDENADIYDEDVDGQYEYDGDQTPIYEERI